MELIEEEYKKIIEKFPDAKLIDDLISHVKFPLINDVFLDINYKNYPKRPKVQLIKSNGQVYKNFDMMISSLRSWRKRDPLPIIELIDEIMNFAKNMEGNEIVIKYELIEGVLALCRNQHPREILGLLRMEKGVFSEFILPPGALTSNTSGVFFPSRIPLDPSLEGTIHSHPSGNANPSLGDLQGVFKKKRFHIICAYPYNNLNCIKCFNGNGDEINFKITY